MNCGATSGSDLRRSCVLRPFAVTSQPLIGSFLFSGDFPLSQPLGYLISQLENLFVDSAQVIAG
jgi:hypothetical protein